MYSSFCSIRSSRASQSRSIKLFLQCAAECQLASFIMALAQSQSMSFIAAHKSAKISIKTSVKINQKSVKTLIEKSTQNADYQFSLKCLFFFTQQDSMAQQTDCD